MQPIEKDAVSYSNRQTYVENYGIELLYFGSGQRMRRTSLCIYDGEMNDEIMIARELLYCNVWL